MTMDTLQTANILSDISTVLFILAGAALVFAAVIFFVYKIPKIMRDLSGRTAGRYTGRRHEADKEALLSETVLLSDTDETVLL